jgi:hypothetical protein
MKASPMRRLVTGGLRAAAVVGIVAAMFNCGGGERPAAETDGPINIKQDAGGPTTGSGITYDVDVDKGVFFGDQGMVDCGKQAAPKTITLKNTTSSIINIAASITVGSDIFKVTPDHGGVPSGGTLLLQVSPNPIPAQSDVTDDLYAGTLEIKYTDTGGPPTDIRLHQTARGAIITTTSGPAITFPATKVGTTSTATLGLANGGNIPVNATFSVGTAVYTVDGQASSTKAIAANGAAGVEVKLAPVTAGPLADTIAIAYNSGAVMCKAPPSSVTLTGSGTTSVGISQSVLDFGQVNCNTTADPQEVDISSTIAMNFTPVLTKGALSAYTMANADTGDPVAQEAQVAVAQASTYKLKIIPKKIDPVSSTADNGFGDTLTITTDVPGDVPHTVQLRETAKGAILAFDRSTISVSGPVGQNINTNFALINKGNALVPYIITASPAPSGSNGGFTSTLTTGNIVGGTGQVSVPGVLISKAATTSGQIVNGTLSVALNGPGVLCADLPPATPLSVTATGSAITVNPTNLPFGFVNCGKAGQAQSIVVASTVSTNITLKLLGGAGSPFVLAHDSAGAQPIPQNGSVLVAPGSPVTIWVIPGTVPVPGNTSDNGYGDTLTLTSDIVTEPVRNVPLTMTGTGANFTFPASVQASKTAPVTFTVTNNGNANGSFDLDTGGVTVVGGNQTVALTAKAVATFTIAANSPAGTVTIKGSVGTPVCGNLQNIAVAAGQ